MLKAAAIILFLFAPWVLSLFTLLRIDQAARKNQQPVKFALVDLFSLTFMVQIPYAILSKLANLQSYWVVATVLAGVMALIWRETIRAVSRAGVTTTSARAWISLLVIPVSYVGSPIFTGLLLMESRPDSGRYIDRQSFLYAVIAKFVLMGLMILAYFKTRQIIRDASTALTSIQPSHSSSPFED